MRGIFSWNMGLTVSLSMNLLPYLCLVYILNKFCQDTAMQYKTWEIFLTIFLWKFGVLCAIKCGRYYGYTCTHMCVYIYNICHIWWHVRPQMYVCVWVYIYIYIYIYIYTHTHTHIHMNIHEHVNLEYDFLHSLLESKMSKKRVDSDIPRHFPY